MQQEANEEYLAGGNKTVDHATITIKAGSAKAVSMGVFGDDRDDPVYDVSFAPDLHDDIGVSHEKLSIPGQERYMLLYQFQNFSDEPCTVTLQHHTPVTR